MTFSLKNSELEVADVPPLKIELLENSQISQRAYRVCPEKRTEINKQVNQMVDNGIIQRSNTLYTSPCLLVKKKSRR